MVAAIEGHPSNIAEKNAADHIKTSLVVSDVHIHVNNVLLCPRKLIYFDRFQVIERIYTVSYCCCTEMLVDGC